MTYRVVGLYGTLGRGLTLVVVVARWGDGSGPRNVLIRRADGSLAVRPFRRLRRSEKARR